MKTFKDIREARGDTCVFTFGRFNPPTIGHEKLIEKVASEAKKVAGAPYYIFASHSENPKKDPLPYTKKVAYMKKMFPKHARNIIVDKARNVFEIAVSLHNKGHRSIIMVAGSDRVAEFEKLLNTYNGVEARHGYYGFDNIEVVSAGERDPDAEGVTGMSASKMRAAASANDFDQFKLGLPSGFKQAMSIFKDVRKYMGIRESFITHQVQQTEEDVIRDMYVEGQIFTIGEEVTDTYTGVTGKIIRRGTNYVTFMSEDGTTYKKWLYEIELAEDGPCWDTHKQVGMKKKNGKMVPNCVPKEDAVAEKQDKDIKDKKGTQPAKYFAKDAEGDAMSKSTKDKRDAHFKKGAAKDDDDDSAYKPAPGDARAKTKPSKYTNKVKKMFPDLYKENKRIPREKGQHRNSSSHSDLYTDENPEGTIKGLKFATVDDAKASVSKIEGSGKTHAHKIQAAIAMEQRAKEMGKTKEAAVYRQYIEKMKKKTKEMQNEGAADKSLAKKAEASGISVSILKQVYKRGVAAWRTGHRPGTTPEQWGHARVNSFISGGKTRTTGDADLWKKHKGKKESYEIGQDYADHTKKMTPGQELSERPSAKRDAMRAMGKRGIDPADIDEPRANATDQANAGKNIIMQLRKSVSLRGNHPVEFEKGTQKVDARIAQAVQDKFAKIKRPADKLAFQNKVAKSYKDMLKALKETYTVVEGMTMMVKHGRKKVQLGDNQTIRMFGKEYKSVGVTKQAVYVVKGADGERVFSKKEFESLLKKGDIEVVDTGSVWQPEERTLSFKEHNSCCDNCAEESNLIESNVYRVGSEKYYEFFQEKRDEYNIGVYAPTGFDKEIMEGDLGKFDMYQGNHVPLDCPMVEEKDVELNKPKVGGPKKYYVYVKDPKTGNVKKVTFGDTTGLKVKLDDKEARKSFAARHDCENQKDKTKAGYWSCNLPRYAKQLGLSGGGNFFW